VHRARRYSQKTFRLSPGFVSSIFRVHHGPRRWVFLPHAVLLAFFLLMGLAEGVELGLLLVYFVLVPILVVQIALPTFAGWILAFAGWTTICSMYMFLEYRRIRMGAISATELWLSLAVVVLSTAPLYFLRPRAKRLAQNEGEPTEEGSGETR